MEKLGAPSRSHGKASRVAAASLALSALSRSPSAAHAHEGRARSLAGGIGHFRISKENIPSAAATDDLRDLLPPRRRRRLRRLLEPIPVPFEILNRLERRRAKTSAPPQVRSKKRQMYLTCFGIVFVWISLGTLFYHRYYQWPLPQSFFYAVDAGMSIGFCTDVEETKVASRAFTIVHILLGASCVGGALVLMVQSALEGVSRSSSAVYRLILEKDSLKKTFLGENPQQLWISPKNWVSRKEKGVISYEEFREALKDNGLVLTEKEFQRVCSFYDRNQEGCIRYEFFSDHFQGIHRILPTSRFMHHRHFLSRTFAQPLDFMMDLFTNENKRIYIIFVLWIFLGITWGIVDQGWDIITATHFAVSALATGGLTAPPVNEDGILPAGAAWFCGLYCLFGIPLMALTLGIFARLLVEGYVVEEELAAIAHPLSLSECRFASKSLCSTDKAIHLSDFIVLQLMRQGKLNLDSFEFMKRQYQSLDQSRRLWPEDTGR